MTSRPRGLTLSTTVGALGAASLVVALTGIGPASSAAGRPAPRTDLHARVHWADGKPLSGRSSQAPGQVVADYLRGQGASAATVDGLRATGGWTARGVQQLRMQQYVAGLRVHGSYVKAALDSSGRLLSVIETTVGAGAPVTAAVDEATALRAAVGSVLPGRSVSVA